HGVALGGVMALGLRIWDNLGAGGVLGFVDSMFTGCESYDNGGPNFWFTDWGAGVDNQRINNMLSGCVAHDGGKDKENWPDATFAANVRVDAAHNQANITGLATRNRHNTDAFGPAQWPGPNGYPTDYGLYVEAGASGVATGISGGEFANHNVASVSNNSTTFTVIGEAPITATGADVGDLARWNGNNYAPSKLLTAARLAEQIDPVPWAASIAPDISGENPGVKEIVWQGDTDIVMPSPQLGVKLELQLQIDGAGPHALTFSGTPIRGQYSDSDGDGNAAFKRANIEFRGEASAWRIVGKIGWH
ncbi:MAG: hypothetical protein AAGJ87_13750, partial [Pseudomonadota bacterium]